MESKVFLSPQSLMALLVAQVATVLLHVPRMPIWFVGLAAVVIVWRIQILYGRLHYPGRWIRGLLALVAIGIVVVLHPQWYALEPMVSLLILAFLLKLLEVKYRRDALTLVYVGYFVTACSFLLSQGIVASLLGIVVLWLLTSCLFVLHSNSRFLSGRYFRKVSILLLQALPLMLLMLFVFPRIGALWSVPLKSDNAVTGVSDSMSPGDYSQLGRSRQTAFRVSFSNDQPPAPSERYWRGVVLTTFNGRRWDRLDVPMENRSGVLTQRAEQPYSEYEVILEPTNTSWLYALPSAEIGGVAYKTSPITEELFLLRAATQRLRYSVRSYARNDAEPALLSDYEMRRSLLLPRGFNPKTLAQAQRWRREAASPEEYISRALRFYNASFTYTLSPPLLGEHSVDDFLFGTQRGFCEHFASSFVVLMRAAGIPARVVAGFQGGEWNETEKYLTVRQYDAHAWAEVWLVGKGWVRVDPTAAVAPERIEQGLFDSLTDDEQALVETRPLPSFAWVNRLVMKWDSMDYRWQQWVLNYDKEKQSQWLSQLLGQVTPVRLALLLFIPAVVFLGVMFWLSLRSPPKPVSRDVKFYRLMVKKLRRKGISIHEGETLSDLCERAAQQLPASQLALMAIKKQLNYQLYASEGELDSARYQQLVKSVAQIK